MMKKKVLILQQIPSIISREGYSDTIVVYICFKMALKSQNFTPFCCAAFSVVRPQSENEMKPKWHDLIGC
jgi:hypothetical protein